MNEIKLVAFDLDGVLVSGRGSWMEVHHALGTQDEAEKHAQAFFDGVISFSDWADLDLRLWKGVEIERIRHVLSEVPLMPGAAETLSELKACGFKVAIISGGLKLLAEMVSSCFGIDYCIGNEFIVQEGRVAGISQDVDFTGKGEILKKIAASEGISTRACACVGDYLNDIPMFKLSGLSIAFNPKDEKLIKYADEVVYGEDLAKILPYFRRLECTLPQQT